MDDDSAKKHAFGWWGWDGHGEEGLLCLCVSQRIVVVSVGDKCGGIHRCINAWGSGYVEWEDGIESHLRIGLHEGCGIVTHLGHVRWDGHGCWEALHKWWEDHEMGFHRGVHMMCSEQDWLVLSVVDMSGGSNAYICVVTWQCLAQLPWHGMPSWICEHLLWSRGDAVALTCSKLGCCGMLQIHRGTSLLPTSPHHASASGASWIKIVIAWCVCKIQYSMMLSS